MCSKTSYSEQINYRQDSYVGLLGFIPLNHNFVRRDTIFSLSRDFEGFRARLGDRFIDKQGFFKARS